MERPCTSLSMSPTGDFLATTHVGELGVFLWANRLLYERVFLKPIDKSLGSVPTLRKYINLHNKRVNIFLIFFYKEFSLMVFVHHWLVSALPTSLFGVFSDDMTISFIGLLITDLYKNHAKLYRIESGNLKGLGLEI